MSEKEEIENMKKTIQMLRTAESTLSQSLILDYTVLTYYIQYRMNQFLLMMVFKQYDINLTVPIPQSMGLKYHNNEEDEYELDSALSEKTYDIEIDRLEQYGWKMESILFGEKLEQDTVDFLIRSLPDGEDEEFNYYFELTSALKQEGEWVDYFAFLYYPDIDNVGHWLKKTLIDNADLFALFQMVEREFQCIFRSDYRNYERIVTGGTWYFPIILSSSEDNYSMNVDGERFQYRHFFHCYVVDWIYQCAVKRGYQPHV